MKRLVLLVLAALILVPVARASEQHPTLAELEGEVMCPVCDTTLDQSSSPAAQQIKRVIANRIAAGDTKSQIKDKLVAEYGNAILAAPPHEGFGLVAWWLPVVGILAAALYDPVFVSGVVDGGSFALALVCFVLLVSWRVAPWIVVLVGAAGGVLLAFV